MNETLKTFQFNGPCDATLTIEAAGVPEAAIMAEKLVASTSQWFFATIGMNLETFLDQAREMFGAA